MRPGRLALLATAALLLVVASTASASGSGPAGAPQTRDSHLCHVLPWLPGCDDRDCDRVHGHGHGHGHHYGDCDHNGGSGNGGGGGGNGGGGGGGNGGGGGGGGGTGGGGGGTGGGGGGGNGGGGGTGGGGGGGTGGGGTGGGGSGGAGGTAGSGPGGAAGTGAAGTAPGAVGAAVDTKAPSFLAIPRLHPKRFRAARRGGSIAVATGTTITYRLDEAARVTFTVQKYRALSRYCVRRLAVNRHRTGSRCRKWISIKGRFAKASAAGASSVRFTGRLKRRALRPGAYRLVVRARDSAGNVTRPRRPTFRIVR